MARSGFILQGRIMSQEPTLNTDRDFQVVRSAIALTGRNVHLQPQSNRAVGLVSALVLEHYPARGIEVQYDRFGYKRQSV
jgi:hypothetical protein